MAVSILIMVMLILVLRFLLFNTLIFKFFPILIVEYYFLMKLLFFFTLDLTEIQRQRVDIYKNAIKNISVNPFIPIRESFELVLETYSNK